MSSIFQTSNTVLELYSNCCLCPHACGVNRNRGEVGFCGATSELLVASVCAHYGEEPVISGKHGICNVFFGRCNLSCKFCQNHQISSNRGDVAAQVVSIDEIVKQIAVLLQQGCQAVGFVSPTHYTPHVLLIIKKLRQNGFNPVFVYNTNCYDNPEVIAALEDYIDVFLPDFKYFDNELAFRLSGINNYKEHALLSLNEMYRQKGSTLWLSDDGFAEKGLIVRHLVLPDCVNNSIGVLRLLADISISLSVSLMSQYHPSLPIEDFPALGRTIEEEEYEMVVSEFEILGFYKGWLQDFESSSNYLPDFDQTLPFTK